MFVKSDCLYQIPFEYNQFDYNREWIESIPMDWIRINPDISQLTILDNYSLTLSFASTFVNYKRFSKIRV